MKKTLLLFTIFALWGMVFITPCFSQNMLILGGEYNLSSPEFWGIGVGFNMKLFNEYIQNDFMVNLGAIRAKEAVIEQIPEDDEQGTEENEQRTGNREQRIENNEQLAIGQAKLLFSVSDKLYFSRDGKWVGLRAGVFASVGVYGIYDFPKTWDLFANAGGFAGVTILPQSFVSINLDLCPGYAVAFRFDDGFTENEAGFSLGLFLGIRFNLDKL